MNQNESPSTIQMLQDQIESLKRLLDYKTPPCSSPEIDKISEALSKAQGEMKVAGKSKSYKKVWKDKEGRYQSIEIKYAGYEDIVKAIKIPLSTNILAYTQKTISAANNAECLVTTLSHSSGQWFRSYSHLPSASELGGPQAYGSYKSYMERYSLKSIVGLPTGEEDDDGVAATEMSSPREPQKQQIQQKKAEPINHISHQVKNVIADIEPKEIEFISPDQISILQSEFKGYYEVQETIFKGLTINSVDKVPRNLFEKVLNRVRVIKEDLKTVNKKPSMS